MMRPKAEFYLAVIVLALSPAVAYADAGTPLMWAGAFHLLLGNVVIGIGEGLLLALLFRLGKVPCVAIMIAANYFSAWFGGAFLLSRIAESLPLDLYNAWRWLWGMVAVSYFLTLLLEWPFIALCFIVCKTKGWFRKSIWGSLVAQSASYLVLFGWYWAASGTSLYTDLAVVPPAAISLPKGVTLYYMAENGTDVCACDVDKGKTRTIGGVTSPGNEDRLLLQESRKAAGRWDLIVGPDTNSRPRERSPSDQVVSANLACTVAEPPSVGFWPGGDVPRFRADKSGWQFSFGWMADGLHGENAMEGRW
jgi:hypothetical protein